MTHSRRRFLAGSAAAAAVGASSMGGTAAASSDSGSSYSKVAAEIIGPFKSLPGTTSVKIFAPATHNRREFLAELNPAVPLFCGSAFKCFVLCEALRRVGSNLGWIESTLLPLNDAVWSLDSTVFNPPLLSGHVSERTALEAMISHSDNTGADIMLAHLVPDTVRSFIASAGLQHTKIPNSTRQFLGYIFGAPNWQTITYDEVRAITQGTPVYPAINNVQTMVSSADDFVSFYSRGLQGEFFTNPAALEIFRSTLMIADAIPLVVPLGATGFAKGGEIDAGGFHALCLAGGMYFSDRWVYFTTMINWTSNQPAPTQIAFEVATKKAFARVKEALE